MEHVKDLKTLETLVLGNTGISDDGVAELKDLKKLKSLTVSGCIKITDKSAETIRGFTELEYLSLPSTITEAGVKDLVGLKKLKTLYLGGTNMTDAGVGHIAANMPDLESLDLGTVSGTQISDISIKPLSNLKRLRSLNLRGSQISEKGLRELKETLPDCRVTG
jgi:Leucine-rich repeat (LRR) protein